MMPNPRLAARYAKSLFDLSLEKGSLDSIYQDMVYLQAVCKASREFVILLKSPVIKADKKEKAFAAVTQGNIGSITSLFVRLLISKNRENVLPEIIPAFIRQYKDLKGIYQVKLTTAQPIAEEVKQAILDKVNINHASQAIELNTVLDESLIGGFILEAGGQMVDTSVAYKLNTVRKEFEKNEFIYRIR
jgi:F-type H+-transporting ATPase subunit delta